MPAVSLLPIMSTESRPPLDTHVASPTVAVIIMPSSSQVTWRSPPNPLLPPLTQPPISADARATQTPIRALVQSAYRLARSLPPEAVANVGSDGHGVAGVVQVEDVQRDAEVEIAPAIARARGQVEVGLASRPAEVPERGHYGGAGMVREQPQLARDVELLIERVLRAGEDGDGPEGGVGAVHALGNVIDKPGAAGEGELGLNQVFVAQERADPDAGPVAEIADRHRQRTVSGQLHLARGHRRLRSRRRWRRLCPRCTGNEQRTNYHPRPPYVHAPSPVERGCPEGL